MNSKFVTKCPIHILTLNNPTMVGCVYSVYICIHRYICVSAWIYVHVCTSIQKRALIYVYA